MVLQCAISTLADYYVEGPYTVPPVARAALASTYVSSGNLTLADYISRSQARINVSFRIIAWCFCSMAFVLYSLVTCCCCQSRSALVLWVSAFIFCYRALVTRFALSNFALLPCSRKICNRCMLHM